MEDRSDQNAARPQSGGAFSQRTSSPTRRRRNAEATRLEILKAARASFIRSGYEGTTIRQIAAEARVDAALVIRYCGRKDEMFRKVISGIGYPSDLLSGTCADFARRVADMLIVAPHREADLDGLLILLGSIGSPKARELIDFNEGTGFLAALAGWVGGPDRTLNALNIAAVMMGMSIVRMLTSDFSEVHADAQHMHRKVCDLIMHLLDDGDEKPSPSPRLG